MSKAPLLGGGAQNNPDSASVTDATLSNLLTTGDALLRRFEYSSAYGLASADAPPPATA